MTLPPPSSTPLALAANDAAGIAIIAAFALLVVLAALSLVRRKRARPPVPKEPVPQAEIERELEMEARPELPPGEPLPPVSPPVEPAVSKGAREALRKEEYRRKKEAERLEKERKRQERAEEERRQLEEAERQAREAEEARRREAEEKERRIRAEAGRTLAAGLEKTRGGFVARLNALFVGDRAIDERVLADLEEVLFTADIGVKTATGLLESARERARRRELSDPTRLRQVLREDIERILTLGNGASGGEGLVIGPQRPFVVMVVGVNGSGKTTTVAKLAAKVKQAGHSVLLGAGDTFRAAAGEQLEIWAERVGAPLVRGKEGSDPASVCFEAVRKGVEEGIDLVLCDTAGRLHTKAPLMEELRKVRRVLAKACEGAPHEVLLVLDATNGQNAIAQARQFNEALGVTGIVLTKLDGTAKGGVIIGICDELKLPVRFVGVGEKVADLREFAPREFVEALFSEAKA
ncbi:MAG TPA: signal recognition particle-docking protein FtsY [Anaeromyxobacteraceae bacterium]|nr:signal recognition particle-docking protein FtsY [Anaeromyxobacteraceae bacterium]